MARIDLQVQAFVFAALFLSLSCTAVQAAGWVERSDAPYAGGYGEAVVGTGDNIYVARCLYATSAPSFSRYDPNTDSWTQMSTTGLPPGAFRSGTALVWDRGDHIYALCGGRYKDTNRKLFYRYSISGNCWGQLTDTPYAQGAGDAVTWSEYDGHIYAVIGSDKRGTVFARYSYDSWETLTFNPNWTFTDDGASLVAVGEYLYVLRGEYKEHSPNGDFARYHIPTTSWEDMSDMPESEGVGDGGSLLYIGDWVCEYDDYIFALGGGGVYEDPGYNFYRYNISGNDWEQLESTPCPIGYYVGNRLGYANNGMYYWQGSPKSNLWICGGDAFYMFGWSPPKTIYVDDDFVDDPPNHRWNTIKEGISDANSGDTIIVKDGIYYENVNVGRHLTIQSENGADVTIVRAVSTFRPVFKVTSDYVSISGFTVMGAKDMSGIRLNSVNHCNITNNIAQNNEDGIYLLHSSNNMLSNNTASNNMRGIYLKNADNNNIVCNLVQNNTQNGFRLYSGSTNNNISYNNIIENGNYNTMTDSWEWQFCNYQFDPVEAKHNYWGAGMNNSTIDASIYDNEEGKGKVKFYSFETNQVPCAPPPKLPSFTPTGATIRIGNASGTMTIPITIEDCVNVGACDITLTYDPLVVNVTNVTCGDMDATVTNLEHTDKGWARIGAFQTGNSGLSGTITFANVALEAGNTGGTCFLNLSVTTFKDETAVGNPMPYVVRNGTYTTAMNGDVDSNGVVDMHDAMYLAKHVLDTPGFTEIIAEAADVNGDGKVTSHDAMYLAKHLIGVGGYEELR